MKLMPYFEIINRNYKEIIIFTIIFLGSISVTFYQFYYQPSPEINNIIFGWPHFSGDEPYYLVLSSLLIKHQSFDLAEFFVDPEPDPNLPFSSKFYGLNPTGHWHGIVGIDNVVYPNHGIGLSFLLIPAYFAAGIMGAFIVFHIIFGLLGVIIFKFCRRISSDKTGIIISLFFSFGTILFTFSTTIYSEIVAGLFIISVIYIFFFKENNFVNISIIGVLLGFLPFLKFAYIVFPVILIPIMSLILLRNKTKRKSLIFLFSIFMISAILLLSYNYWTTGNIGIGGGNAALILDESRLAQQDVLIGIVNYLFGKSYGLFVFSPLVILSVFGMVSLWKHDKVISLTVAITFVGFLIAHSYVQPYAANWTMPTRYIVPIIPLMSIPLAIIFEKYSKNFIFLLVFFVSSGIGFIFNVVFGLIIHSHLRVNERAAMAEKIWFKIGEIFPLVDASDRSTVNTYWDNISPIFWIVILGLIFLIVMFIFYTRNHDIKFQPKKIKNKIKDNYEKSKYTISIFCIMILITITSVMIFDYYEYNFDNSIEWQISNIYIQINDRAPTEEEETYYKNMIQEGKDFEWLKEAIKETKP